MYVAQGLLNTFQCRWRSHSCDHPGTNTHTHTHLPPSAHTHTLDPSLGASGLPYAARGHELKTLINIISIIIEI